MIDRSARGFSEIRRPYGYPGGYGGYPGGYGVKPYGGYGFPGSGYGYGIPGGYGNYGGFPGSYSGGFGGPGFGGYGGYGVSPLTTGLLGLGAGFLGGSLLDNGPFNRGVYYTMR